MTFVFGDLVLPSLVAMGGKSWICIMGPDPERIAASWMRLADCEFCWEETLQLHTVDGRNPAPPGMHKAL